MPTGHTTAQQKKVVNPKPSSKRAREQRSDDGPVILPGMEHFVDLVRKARGLMPAKAVVDDQNR